MILLRIINRLIGRSTKFCFWWLNPANYKVDWTMKTYTIKALEWQDGGECKFRHSWDSGVGYEVVRSRFGEDGEWREWNLEIYFGTEDSDTIEVDTPEEGMKLASEDWEKRMLKNLIES